jgi:hypothetical protein
MDQNPIKETLQFENDAPDHRPGALLFILCAGLFLLFFVGCSTAAKTAQWEIITGPDHELNNVHKLAPKLPERLRRVAILPLSVEPGTSDLNTARESLEPILQSELDRLNVFEVIRVSPEHMRQYTGRAEWSASDKLPQNFLSTLKNETGADGVLFCRLTRYHAYPPLAIGWSLKLVDATDAQVWWAADEMFDSSDPRVVNSARRWQLDHQKYHKANPLLADSKTVLISPRRLGQYSAATLFATLPQR